MSLCPHGPAEAQIAQPSKSQSPFHPLLALPQRDPVPLGAGVTAPAMPLGLLGASPSLDGPQALNPDPGESGAVSNAC